MFRFHNQVISALTELSDRDMQVTLWLAAEGDFSSFVEAVEQLFSDTGLGDALDTGGTEYGYEVDDMFRNLGAVLDEMDSSRDPLAIIESSEMAEVRRLSSAILFRILQP